MGGDHLPLFVNLFNNVCKKISSFTQGDQSCQHLLVFSSSQLCFPPYPVEHIWTITLIISHVPLTILLHVFPCSIHCLSWWQLLPILCVTQSSPSVTWQDTQESWSVFLEMHDYHVGRVGLWCSCQNSTSFPFTLTSLLKTNRVWTFNLSPSNLNIFYTLHYILWPAPITSDFTVNIFAIKPCPHFLPSVSVPSTLHSFLWWIFVSYLTPIILPPPVYALDSLSCTLFNSFALIVLEPSLTSLFRRNMS